MRNSLLTLLALLLVSAGCGKTREGIPGSAKAVPYDSALGYIAADTIIYDVIIRNTNPDDSWTSHRLGGVHHSVLIDSVFNMVYAGRISAFNHDTREKLTVRQVREIEASDGFSRENISMIQFTEVWYLNPAEAQMTKKVLSMVLGYNYYNPEGELFGHKPVFRVDLK